MALGAPSQILEPWGAFGVSSAAARAKVLPDVGRARCPRRRWDSHTFLRSHPPGLHALEQVVALLVRQPDDLEWAVAFQRAGGIVVNAFARP